MQSERVISESWAILDGDGKVAMDFEFISMDGFATKANAESAMKRLQFEGGGQPLSLRVARVRVVEVSDE